MRYRSLDVLRGYAALSVMIAHNLHVVMEDKKDLWKLIEWSPLRIFFAGHQAVIMFFVLSGFALTIMIKSMKSFSYLKYLTARVVRLWIPYAVSLALCYIVVAALVRFGFDWDSGVMGTSPKVINKSDFLNHLFMIGEFNPYSINPPVWSLVQEMRISIIFPIILMLSTLYGLRFFAATLACSIACCIYFYGTMYANMAEIKDSLIFTISFISSFSCGCLIALNVKSIESLVLRVKKEHIFIIFILACIVYSYSFNRPWSASKRLMGDIAICLSSAVIICTAFRLKDGSIMRIGCFLGNISFSLYLTHIAILTAMVAMFYNHINTWLLFLISLILSMVVAVLFTKTIDATSINLSRMIYRK